MFKVLKLSGILHSLIVRYICTEVINDFVRQVIVPPHYTLYDNVVSVLGEDEVSPASAGTKIIVLVCT